MDNKQNFTIYVINLDERPDKLKFISDQMKKANFNFERVPAYRYDNSKMFQKEDYLPPLNVQANWNSHLLVYEKLVNSPDNFCVILEDDCKMSDNGFKVLRLLNEINTQNLDILQIGFLQLESKLEYKSIQLSKIKVQLIRRIKVMMVKIKLLSRQERKIKYIEKKIYSLEYKLNQSKMLELPKLIVPEFLSGTHAYLIHRRMAEVLLRYNNPIVMGADLAIQILALSGNWRIYRTPFL